MIHRNFQLPAVAAEMLFRITKNMKSFQRIWVNSGFGKEENRSDTILLFDF